jgi:hypothetical protein
MKYLDFFLDSAKIGGLYVSICDSGGSRKSVRGWQFARGGGGHDQKRLSKTISDSKTHFLFIYAKEK